MPCLLYDRLSDCSFIIPSLVYQRQTAVHYTYPVCYTKDRLQLIIPSFLYERQVVVSFYPACYTKDRLQFLVCFFSATKDRLHLCNMQRLYTHAARGRTALPILAKLVQYFISLNILYNEFSISQTAPPPMGVMMPMPADPGERDHVLPSLYLVCL